MSYACNRRACNSANALKDAVIEVDDSPAARGGERGSVLERGTVIGDVHGLGFG